MKNKDRMQFNLKNWRKLNWSLWNKEDENKASFEKILNKDKYKKKWGNKMELIELYGIKIKELTEILKDERVRKFEIKEYTNYIDYLIISFELNYEKKIQFDIRLSDVKDYQSRSLSIEEISSQFDKKIAKLRGYLESKNKGELKELEDKISNYETKLKKAKEQYDKINDYGENL